MNIVWNLKFFIFLFLLFMVYTWLHQEGVLLLKVFIYLCCTPMICLCFTWKSSWSSWCAFPRHPTRCRAPRIAKLFTTWTRMNAESRGDDNIAHLNMMSCTEIVLCVVYHSREELYADMPLCSFIEYSTCWSGMYKLWPSYFFVIFREILLVKFTF